MLRLVFNTFTADEKYSLLNRDNLTQTIYIQLSQKQKTFSGIFFAVLKFILNFEHFSNKNDPHTSCISEITVSEKRGYIIV